MSNNNKLEENDENKNDGFSSSDIGKKVIGSDDQSIGNIVDVSYGTAFVEPNDELSDKDRAELGWGLTENEIYPLNSGFVEEITEEAVRIEL